MPRTSGRPKEFDFITDRIAEALGRHDLPSVAVAIAQRGEILWEEGFGLADRARMVPATEHTMYSLASVSKPFTTTALMVLVERGLIDLDDPVNAYLGEGKVTARVGDAQKATARRLANHTSGLPLHHNYFYDDEPYVPPPMDETIRRYGNLVTSPGERYQYANLGYGILGHIIERVSGQPYAEFLRDEVVRPLGLTHTSVWVPAEFEAQAAREYGGDNVVYPRKVSDHPGAGALYSSVHDVVRFGMFHLKQRLPDQRQILSDRTVEAMQTVTARETDGTGYGIGWTVDENLLGNRVVGHTGASGGVTTQLALVPDEEIVVAVLTNSSRPNPYLPSQLTGDLLGALLPAVRERLADMRTESQDAAEDAALSGLPLTGRWEGYIHTYQGDLPLALDGNDTTRAWLGGRPVRAIDVTRSGDHVTGRIEATLPTPEASRRPHHLDLDLTVRGVVMNGAAVAATETGKEGGAPALRMGFALGHWTELRRTE